MLKAKHFTYIRPSELLAKHPDCGESLGKLQKLANQPDKQCITCNNKAWKYGNTGMCFSCTTGESDPSNDYELIPE